MVETPNVSTAKSAVNKWAPWLAFAAGVFTPPDVLNLDAVIAPLFGAVSTVAGRINLPMAGAALLYLVIGAVIGAVIDGVRGFDVGAMVAYYFYGAALRTGLAAFGIFGGVGGAPA